MREPKMEMPVNRNKELMETFKNSMPVKIVDKIVREGEETEYNDEPSGASYYRLVEFDNGKRIPYPLMNIEGADTSAFEHGEIGRSDDEKNAVNEQEEIIKKAYEQKPELKAKFEELQKNIFEKEQK